MAPGPPLSYVDRVVMEIIETERMYVRDLRMIVEDYLAHIIDHADLSVGPELVCALFGNIEDIYEFNSELLQSLDQCDNDPVAVARCFVTKSEYFDIYTQYCTNYPNSVAALTECMRSKALAKFFRERQASLKRSLPLGSYLLKPVQRILKYHLLLQEIAKHSDQQGADYEVVEEAIYTMTGVAWYINDMKRRHEHAVRLQEVQSLLLHWKGPDLTTYGELVLEGTFKVHRAKNERTLFLLDRMLLITKHRGEHYVYKAHISCSTLMLIESAKDSLSFSVSHYKHLKQPHTVQARNLEEKKLWSHHIKRIILENHQAIIPQKAKEAILEMDSIYPSKYRYSPDRLKKALSVQSDEVPPESRQGRRQSEPTKLLSESTKAVLKDEEMSSLVQDKQLQRPPVVEDTPAELQASEHQEKSEPKDPRSLTSPKISASPRGPKKLAAEPAEPTAAEPPTAGEVENPKEHKNEPPSSTAATTTTTQDSNSKSLTSEESSEEEEEEEEEEGREAAGKETKSTSILPSSVLSRSGAIAQHFTGSIRRPSLASDNSCSPSCLSPRLLGRSGSILSPGSDGSDVFRPADGNLLSPRDSDDGMTGGQRQRRDSTLSRHDQLLIGKIKSYYEVAESQDPAFCLRRRESLTSIPTGLVRSSVSHFNCAPPPATAETRLPAGEGVRMKPLPSDADDDDDQAPGEPDSGGGAGEEEQEEEPAGTYRQQPRSAVVVGGSVGYSSALATAPALQEEEFRSSSEMIQIWQAMEEDLGRTAGRRVRETPAVQALRTSRKAAAPGPTSDSCLAPNHHSGVSGENGGSDLGTITEESGLSGLSAKHRGRTAGPAGRAGSLQETLKLWGGEASAPRLHRTPRVLELRGRAPQGQDQDSQDDPDSAKSKVLSLARQYSQRIKTSRPDPRLGKRTLTCVLEESESSGKPTPSLPLAPGSQSRTGGQLSPVEGPDSVTRVRSRSPASPTATDEGFCWPDVRELRSKYGSLSSSDAPVVGRSLSVPEKLTDSWTKRCSSYNSSLFHPAEGAAEGGEGGGGGGRSGVPPSDPQQEGAGRSRLHRATSLDHRLSAPQLSYLEKLPEEVASSASSSNGGFHGYYISGEAALPGDGGRRIIVMEKLPENPLAGTTRGPIEPAGPVEPAAVEEEDRENFVQIRSPTSREKISIMAVIDRCRAYQETEEYKLREEAAARVEAGVSGGRGKPDADKTPAGSVPTESEALEPGSNQNSLVRNLRDKFQNLR